MYIAVQLSQLLSSLTLLSPLFEGASPRAGLRPRGGRGQAAPDGDAQGGGGRGGGYGEHHHGGGRRVGCRRGTIRASARCGERGRAAAARRFDGRVTTAVSLEFGGARRVRCSLCCCCRCEAPGGRRRDKGQARVVQPAERDCDGCARGAGGRGSARRVRHGGGGVQLCSAVYAGGEVRCARRFCCGGRVCGADISQVGAFRVTLEDGALAAEASQPRAQQGVRGRAKRKHFTQAGQRKGSRDAQCWRGRHPQLRVGGVGAERRLAARRSARQVGSQSAGGGGGRGGSQGGGR